MGSKARTVVHFALMSRSEIDIDELRAVSGVDESCNVIFHGEHASTVLRWIADHSDDVDN